MAFRTQSFYWGYRASILRGDLHSVGFSYGYRKVQIRCAFVGVISCIRCWVPRTVADTSHVSKTPRYAFFGIGFLCSPTTILDSNTLLISWRN